MISFTDKVLLVTGGTGSFGNTIVKWFLENSDIGEIRVFSRDEKKQDDMRHEYKNGKIKFYIGDVRDLPSIRNAISGVDFVFHAAALKQVPSCEFFPLEAVKTNIIGTDNVLSACMEYGVKKVVCLSTDKAVYPVNAMGISKAMMEKVFLAKSRLSNSGHTLICGTRYGNVMNSRGSVIPLFIDQIRKGIPLTVTEPKMTRFIMSLDEAVELVLYAFHHASSGDILVKKAPSCYIGDLAEALKEIFGVSNPVEIIGIRHGEKMYEALLSREEAARAEDLGDFYRVPADIRDLNYSKYLENGSSQISFSDEYTSMNTHILNMDEIKKKLLATQYIRDELDRGVAGL